MAAGCRLAGLAVPASQGRTSVAAVATDSKRGNPWVILLVVSLGFFMTLLDLTIVNIAIPNMISKLHASLDDILWVINAYALVLAVLLITCGRLGDLFGQRKLFFAGIALFTLASAACGLSTSPGYLIGFRAVQGLGAALLMPQTLAILTMVFPPERRGAAFGVWGAVAGIATIAGPTLGGLLVTAFDWRYIFFVNVPIGAVVLVLTLFLIPDLRTGRRHSFDITGVVLASLALLAICYALVEGQKYNWGTITSVISIPLLLGVGFVLLGLFLFFQARRQDGEPLVPFSLFRDRNYALMNVVSGFIAIGMLGIFLPFSIYLQSVLGFSALKAGLTMAPASLVSMFVAPVAGRMSDRIGGKYILMAGLLLFAGGMGALAFIAQPSSAWYDFLAPLFVAGLGIGCTFAPMTTVAMRNVNPIMAGAASGVFNTTRQVGTVIGTAGVGALLQNRLIAGFTTQVQQRGAALPVAARDRLLAGFQSAAKGGLEVGSGARTTGLAGEIFTHGFVDAMRPTILVPIVFLFAGALSCLFVKAQQATGDGSGQASDVAEPTATTAG
jgi:EmrB/QacA subfamily drug resistance transporter